MRLQPRLRCRGSLLTLLLVVFLGDPSHAQGPAPPRLAPPIDPSPVPELPPLPVDEAPDPPLLVVPSLPTPRSGPGPALIDMPAIRPLVPVSSSMADEAAAAPPDLVAPSEVGEPASSRLASPRPLAGLSSTSPASRAPDPLEISSTRRAPDPLGAVAPELRPNAATLRDSNPAAIASRSRPSAAPQPSSTRRKLFGFIPFGRPIPAPQPAFSRPDDAESSLDDLDDQADDGDARLDRIADRALEDRLTAQIRNAAGSRIRALEVHAAGRKIYVRAQPARFWQKRGLERTLEALPALAGYQTRIDVVD